VKQSDEEKALMKKRTPLLVVSLSVVALACGSLANAFMSGGANPPPPASEKAVTFPASVYLLEPITPCETPPCGLVRTCKGHTSETGHWEFELDYQYVVVIAVGNLENKLCSVDDEPQSGVGLGPKPGDGVISGLQPITQEQVEQRLGIVEKQLDATTSIACRAGTSSFIEGVITPQQLDDERIENLEACAEQLINANTDFNFYSSDDVVDATCAVRKATDDGAHPGQSGQCACGAPCFDDCQPEPSTSMPQ
jgi:hypothetical protein